MRGDNWRLRLLNSYVLVKQSKPSSWVGPSQSGLAEITPMVKLMFWFQVWRMISKIFKVYSHTFDRDCDLFLYICPEILAFSHLNHPMNSSFLEDRMHVTSINGIAGDNVEWFTLRGWVASHLMWCKVIEAQQMLGEWLVNWVALL